PTATKISSAASSRKSSSPSSSETERPIMDVAIDTGADAPAPTALELTAPADTPAYLSTHDAAAVLRKLRQPKANDTTTTDPRARTPLRRSRVKNRPLPMQRTTPLLWMHRIPAQRPKALIREPPSFRPSSRRGLGRRKTRS